MSGHSKWSTIKRAKESNDLRKAKLFTKALNQIVLAVRNGGSNIDNNFILKTSIEKAKSLNVPSSSIDNAIRKGSGVDKDEDKFESVFYEAYGPGNTSLLIECYTDNKNRVISEIRFVLDRNKGKLVNNGTLDWQFDLQMLFTLKITDTKSTKDSWRDVNKERDISNLEEFEIDILDVDGLIDYSFDEGFAYIYVDPLKIDAFKIFFESKLLRVDNIEKVFIPKIKIDIKEEDLADNQCLIELLEDLTDINGVYYNF